MELTIRNGLFEKALTLFVLASLVSLTITVFFLSYERHAGFEDGNSGGSIMISLASTPGSDSSAQGNKSSDSEALATDKTEALSAPESKETSKEITEATPTEVVQDETIEEIVEPEIQNPPVVEEVVEQPPEKLPPLVEPKVTPEPEVAEIPKEFIEPDEIVKPEEPVIELTKPVTAEMVPTLAPEQLIIKETKIEKLVPPPLPKPKPKPPVREQVVEKKAKEKVVIEPITKPVEITEDTLVKPEPAAKKAPVQTALANNGKNIDSSQATLKGPQSSDQKSSGQEGASSNRGTNTALQKENAGGSGQKATGNYWRAVQIRLGKNKSYPRKAQRRNMEGVAMIELTLLASGKVQSYKILTSTGHRILDKAVVKMIKKSSPFPPFPESINQTLMARRVPVVFSLQK